MAAGRDKLLVFAGSYADAANSGIYVYEFDRATGALNLLNAYAGVANPTFLNVDADNRKLYAITDGKSPEGGKTGIAVAYAIDPDKGTLQEIGRADTVPAPTCHIQRDSAGRYLMTASYHGGLVGLNAIEPDGRVGASLDVRKHEGRSVHPQQDRPHPHSVFLSPDERYAFVPDLGLDRVMIYRLDREANRLIEHAHAAVAPGAGPRHLAIHPNGTYAYVINELDSTVTVLRYDADQGTLEPVQTVPALPEGWTPGSESETNSCSEILVSPDGRFVYGGNRGHDSIAVFAVEADGGKLTPVQHMPSGGGHPRNFALTPDGDYLLAANRDSDNIVTFRIDRDTGKLAETGQVTAASKPVCVRPVYL